MSYSRSARAGRLAAGLLPVLGLLTLADRPAAAAAALRAQDGPSTGPLVAAVTLLAWAAVGWLALVAALTMVGRAGGPLGRASTALLRLTAPAALRQAVAVALGVGVVLGTAGAASAASPPPAAAASSPAPDLDWPGLAPPPVSPAPTVSGATAGPAGAGPAPTATAPAPGSARAARVVVRPGDSLWSLAARRLPPSATARDVATAWPAWWAANRAVIGADPDLLHPGQSLVPPPTP